jgi:hypothetical protein
MEIDRRASERRNPRIYHLTLVFLMTGLLGTLFPQVPIRAHLRSEDAASSRLAKLVEANIIATHAYQILLAKKSGKGDPACYSSGTLSESDLETLVAHQTALLRSDPAAIAAWARIRSSSFDPTKDLEPILSSGLTVPAAAPVNVFNNYLRAKGRSERLKGRSIASLYQTVLEVERDGDLLQQQFAFYITLGLPVYVGQVGLAGSDRTFLDVGKELAQRTCVSPFDTDAAAWQIAGRKVWNWGEKNLHVRDEKVLAAELLRERDVRALIPGIHSVAAEKVAVVGHSFTMGLHWSSPSSFVPIVTEIFRRENPKVEFKQFAAGGLTASRAEQRFYNDVVAWKPDKVLLVVINRRDEDYEALKRMGENFKAAGIKAYIFDDINDPESDKPGVVSRTVDVARNAGFTVIEVGEILASSPDRSRFVCLDNIHMTEPYHRLMAKEWLKFLAGARPAKFDSKSAQRAKAGV